MLLNPNTTITVSLPLYGTVPIEELCEELKLVIKQNNTPIGFYLDEFEFDGGKKFTGIALFHSPHPEEYNQNVLNIENHGNNRSTLYSYTIELNPDEQFDNDFSQLCFQTFGEVLSNFGFDTQRSVDEINQ